MSLLIDNNITKRQKHEIKLIRTKLNSFKLWPIKDVITDAGCEWMSQILPLKISINELNEEKGITAKGCRNSPL